MTLSAAQSRVRSHVEPQVEDAHVVQRVRVSHAGILTLGEEELVIERDPPEVGRAVALRSGGRLAFRRVLGIENGSPGGRRTLRLRADVAPFEDRWDGEIVGCVRPRLLDRLVALDAERFTRASWLTAVATAHAKSVRRRVKQRGAAASLYTKSLVDADWPSVRSFWKEACGDELPVEAHKQQHVVGLFDSGARHELVGANIHLVFGKASYSAFTLVDRRYRSLGGGVKMIRHAVSVARDLDLDSIYVHIGVRNLPSLRAYRRVGFVEKRWWSDDADPLASAERQWRVVELDLKPPR